MWACTRSSTDALAARSTWHLGRAPTNFAISLCRSAPAARRVVKCRAALAAFHGAKAPQSRRSSDDSRAISTDNAAMGDVFDFRDHMGKRKRRAFRNYAPMVLAGLTIGGAMAVGIIHVQEHGLPAFSFSRSAKADTTDFTCTNPRVVDGDTLRCGSLRVRLAHIDAPELPGHCNPGRSCVEGDPYASTNNLVSLVNGADVRCRTINIDRFGRTVALCSANGRDLSCAQRQGGYAVERYGVLRC